MARNDALLILHSRLGSRRKELLGTIEEQLGALRHDHGAPTGGDELDVAALSMNSELTSQLAEHESRELMHIERALHRLREGTYGICEVCEKKIPIERLNALPYTTVCVICQRELETNPELREELELRHEREMAGLSDEDEDEEESEERDGDEPIEEEMMEDEPPRRGRRGAPSKPTVPVAKTPAPAKSAPVAKPAPAAKHAPAKTNGVSKHATKASVVSKTTAKASASKSNGVAKHRVAAKAAPVSKTSSKKPAAATKANASKSAAKSVVKAPAKGKAKAGGRSR